MGLVREPKADLPVDLGLVEWVGVAEHGEDRAEAANQGVDLVGLILGRGRVARS